MRLLIAMMKHETNTFSPVPTPLARFGNGPGPLYGDAAIRAFRGTGTGLGAYLDLAARERAEIVLPIAAGAPPSRPVEDDAYVHITDTICEAVARGGFDGGARTPVPAVESPEQAHGRLLGELLATSRIARSRRRNSPSPSSRLCVTIAPCKSSMMPSKPPRATASQISSVMWA